MAETISSPQVNAEIAPPPMMPPLAIDDWPEDVIVPPTEDELPYEDDEPMETERHRKQMNLLLESLELHWRERENWYAGGNMFVYFSLEQVKNKDFRGPDFFAVLGVPRRERKSYVVWQEGKAPDVVIELLSDKTAAFDQNEKKEIYLDKLGVPEYYWFDPFTGEWAGFRLHGRQYAPLTPDAQDRLVSEVLQLALTRRAGTYQGDGGTWLRWETLDGQLLPTGEEWARAAQQEAEAARHETETAQRDNQLLRQQAADLEAALAKYRAQFGDLPD